MRTSISHPLQIAEVSAGAGLGIVGLTFCPGKKDPNGMTGAWNRDLDLDLDSIRDWGAAAVVTLLEPMELDLLRVHRMAPTCWSIVAVDWDAPEPSQHAF